MSFTTLLPFWGYDTVQKTGCAIKKLTHESLLTSSLRHPKIFVKEFSDFLMSCHQHCLGVNLLVQR